MDIARTSEGELSSPKKKLKTKPDKETHVHRLRFYRPDNIFVVKAMAYDKESRRLAILKNLYHPNDNQTCCSIEIWSYDGSNPVLLQTMYEDDYDRNPFRGIAWGSNNRFFSCRDNSTFNEHDLSTNLIKKSFTVGGGPVLCLACDSSRTRLATGSLDGSLSVFLMGNSSNDVSFGKLLGKSSTQIVSIVWSNDSFEDNELGKHTRIITGCIDYIYIWSYRKGTCLDKLLVGSNDTVVLSLSVWNNRILMAGDSSGMTSFWDIKNRVAKEKFKLHEGAVLSVTVSDDGVGFSSGSDPRIARFKITKDRIFKEDYLYHHKHDVNSLVFGPKNLLLSAGNGPFMVHSNEKKTTSLFLSLKNYLTIHENTLLIRYRNHLEMYSFQVGKDPEKIAVIKSKVAIIGSTARNNMITYWTAHKLVILEKEGSALKKVRHNLPQDLNPLSFQDVFFIEDGSRLGLVVNNSVMILSLENDNFNTTKTVAFPSKIHRVVPSDKFVVILESTQVFTVKICGKEFDTSSMGVLDYLPVDYCLEKNNLWFLLSDQTIKCWDLESSCIMTDIDLKKKSMRNKHGQELYRGLAVVAGSLLVYSSDRIRGIDTDAHDFKSNISKYQRIAKIGVANQEEPTLTLVEVPEETLVKLLPEKTENKATRPFFR